MSNLRYSYIYLAQLIEHYCLTGLLSVSLIARWTNFESSVMLAIPVRLTHVY
jgi:hypothetical protein